MKQALQIFVDRLKDGRQEKIRATLSPEVINVHETELDFKKDVEVDGEAYLAQNELVIRFQVKTVCEKPCNICNEMVVVPLHVQNAYHAVPLEEIKGAVFDLSDQLRETILLEIPAFAECCDGKCPHRAQMGPFLKNKSAKTDQTADEGYNPFARLKIDNSKIVDEP